jgi:hypothetical protein
MEGRPLAHRFPVEVNLFVYITYVFQFVFHGFPFFPDFPNSHHSAYPENCVP